MHERAFRRWSIPDATDLDAVSPASFRVYTPAELRSAPLRPAFRPAATSRHDRGLGEANPRAFIRWLGSALTIGTLLVVAFVLVLDLADYRVIGLAGLSARSTVTSMEPSSDANDPVAAAATPSNDFELADDTDAIEAPPEEAPSVPSRRLSAKARKPKLAARNVPF